MGVADKPYPLFSQGSRQRVTSSHRASQRQFLQISGEQGSRRVTEAVSVVLMSYRAGHLFVRFPAHSAGGRIKSG